MIPDGLGRVSTRGQVNHVAWRYAIAGGNWNEGVRNGARTLNLNANGWNTNGNIGVRGVSDAPRKAQDSAVLRRRRGIGTAEHPRGSAAPSRPGFPVEHQKRPAHRDTKPCAGIHRMGKKHDHLIEQIADWDNLLRAFRKARAGKRGRAEVRLFSADLWLHLGNIQHHLLAGTYRMGEYRSFVVYEPKRREILAAPFGDRVVQHAIMNIVEPIWHKAMISDTYACRPGMGTHIGVDRLQRWLRDMTKNQPLETLWIAKTDFAGYFRSIHHADLKRVVRRKIACARTLKALDAIIDSTPGDVGIPVGNLTSQWMANLLGNEIDQWVKRELRTKRYLRYMDDCVAIFAHRAEADLFVARMEERAAGFGLRFSKWSVHRASQGINSLGYRIWPTHKLLRRRSILAFRRDMRALTARLQAGTASADAITARVKSFVSHSRHADTMRLRKKLFAEDFFAKACAPSSGLDRAAIRS